MTRTRSLTAGIVAVVAVMALAASCTPAAAPAGESWTFKANSVKINDSQDELRDPFFGACIAIPNCDDEPEPLQIGFRVKVGVPNSAQTFVVNNRGDAPSVGEGSTRVLTGNQQNAATFANVKPLSLIDLFNSANHLEVVGAYTWASEVDLVGNGVAADGVAGVLKDALNATIAKGSLPADASFILDLILDNIVGALGLLAQNVPLFGFGDDVLGGSLFLGIGAKGDLANIINSAIGSTPPLTFNIPLLDLPPDIVGSQITTFGGAKTFTQQYSGSGGTHTYEFGWGPT
ncbi:MAG: hypothetical protein F2942_07490 [Actinobacteria bacterium]|uniref:Unannotated protein n=1 Tax=freshwater metagenome TaxID=449393 RepID=A0A6J7UQH4_9ZZZZ|nr:hypothetical protein [Actinomycetota bacterium]